jgi:hypothetical protein
MKTIKSILMSKYSIILSQLSDGNYNVMYIKSKDEKICSWANTFDLNVALSIFDYTLAGFEVYDS